MNADSPKVAIVGAGITGICLAIGLLARNVNVRVYERAHSFREIGAGIGFTPNAEWAMKVIDPRIHAAFKRVATPNASDWFQWVDGFHEQGEDPRVSEEPPLFKIYLGERGFEGCHRADFLTEIAALLPEGTVVFGKQLVGVDESHGIDLRFRDGTTEKADALIGCDGIRSRVRVALLGEDDAAARPHYSHKYAARGLIPMERARQALGEAKVSTRFMHLGHGAHALTFPVAQGTLVNVVAFVSDSKPWPHADKLTDMGTKADVAAAFAAFGPTVRTIIDLLPEAIDRWAVFDTYDHPARTYTRDCMCIAGDAAHAAAPHHGAGAGFGIEDAAVLSELLAQAATKAQGQNGNKTLAKEDAIRGAFDAYNTSRLERTQWLVDSSRFLGEMYEWQDPEVGSDSEKCHDEAYSRSHRIWDYDVGEMIRDATNSFEERLQIALAHNKSVDG